MKQECISIMSKSPKKYTKLLVLTLTLIILLSIGVNVLMHMTSFGNTGHMRSGNFVNTSQGIDSHGWHFFADEANGHSTFFTNFSQIDLDNLLIENCVIGSGDVELVMTQDATRLVFDLNNGAVEMTPADIGTLVPGRVEMRLYYTYAQNVNVNVTWNES